MQVDSVNFDRIMEFIGNYPRVVEARDIRDAGIIVPDSVPDDARCELVLIDKGGKPDIGLHVLCEPKEITITTRLIADETVFSD